MPVHSELYPVPAQRIQEWNGRWLVKEHDDFTVAGLLRQVRPQPLLLPLPVRRREEIFLVRIEDKMPAPAIETGIWRTEYLFVVAGEGFTVAPLQDLLDLRVFPPVFQCDKLVDSQIAKALVISVVTAEHGQYRRRNGIDGVAKLFEFRQRPPIGQVPAHNEQVRRCFPHELSQILRQHLALNPVFVQHDVGIADMDHREGSLIPIRQRQEFEIDPALIAGPSER